MTPDFSATTIQAAQANTLAAIKIQVTDLNKVLKDNYLTGFNNWAQTVIAGRPANGDPPKPPNAFVVGYFTDPTTGPGSGGFYGDTPYQWAYPATGTAPVCAMPPLPTVVPPPPPLPEPENIRNVPLGDTTPVGMTVTAPDGVKWQKHASPTPFGIAYYYTRVA